jgi:hypothetical protein
MRPEDITDQEVRGFDDGEVLQHVHNVDQMLRDVEFQRVYTPSELARLKQFIDFGAWFYSNEEQFPFLFLIYNQML